MKKQYTAPEIRVITYCSDILQTLPISGGNSNLVTSPDEIGSKSTSNWEEDGEDW